MSSRQKKLTSAKEASFTQLPKTKKIKDSDFKGDFKKLRGIVNLPDDFDIKDFKRKRLEGKYFNSAVYDRKVIYKK